MQEGQKHRSPDKAERLELFKQRGYFIMRGLIAEADCERIRSALHAEAARLAEQSSFNDALLEMSAKAQPMETPLHERFRKLSQLHRLEPLWTKWLAHPALLAVVQDFLGDQLLVKYASAFLKPARIGGATPWHQDIGLWRDRNATAINAWLAIDPATKNNGCLQMRVGSHTGPVIPHVVYEDSVHGELPREQCEDIQVEHIELHSGDVVFWHSHLWHYSPPNTSAQSRMGCGGVWTSEADLQDCHPGAVCHWAMRRGQVQAYPSTAHKNTAARTTDIAAETATEIETATSTSNKQDSY